VCNLKYVLIILSGGIINQVTFYDEAHRAVSNFSDYVNTLALSSTALMILFWFKYRIQE
jgi:hypothetical protein